MNLLSSCTLPYLLFVIMWRLAWGFYAQPEAVHFLEAPGHVTTCEGCGSVVLTCSIARQQSAADVPPPEIVWMFNGTVLSEAFPEAQVEQMLSNTISTSQLTLSTPHTIHSGWYSCEARDGSRQDRCDSLPCVPATTFSNPGRVQVLDDSATMETVHWVHCGAALLLSCGLASGTLPTRWLRDGVEVLPQQKNEWLLPNNDLLVRSHDNSNHTYSCISELQGSNDSLVNLTLSRHKLHTLTPSTPPTNSTDVHLLNHRPVLYEGESTALVCVYDNVCNGTATPLWYHDGEPVEPIRLSFSGQVVQLEKVGVAQSGVYCCVVEGVESCTTLHIVENGADEATTHFIDPSISNATLHIHSPLPTPHPGLHWYHNGRQLESHQGQTSVNLSSDSTFDLYGIYQSVVEDSDGSLRQLSLTRVMPYGWTNPPSQPSFLEVPRYNALPKAAIRISWTPPTYKGGLDQLFFNIHTTNYLLGAKYETGPVQGNQTIVNYTSYPFFPYNIRVGLVSESGTVLSEWGGQRSLTVEGVCTHDVKPVPSIITFTCENGRVDLEYSYAGGQQHRAGGCTVSNETVKLPGTNPASLDSVPVGTVCSFSAAEGGRAPCEEESRCHCYDTANLVYMAPVFCNVTGSVHFIQSEYSVNESDLYVEVCVTALGFGFSVVMETHPNTSTAPEDYASESVVLEFTADTLTLCHNVTIHNDGLLEEAEQFMVTLTTDNPHVDITSPTTVITIQDDDYVNVSLVLSSEVVYESASNLSFCVSVGDNLRRELSLRLDTANGTALEGTDFVGLHTELHFKPQNTTTCLSVDLLDDHVLESDKSFLIDLTSESESVRGVGRTEAYIMDDDSVSVAFVGNSTHLPRNATTFEVCVTVTGELDKDINVTLATSGDDEKVISELLFNQSQTLVCMDLPLNLTDQPLRLVLLTSDLSINITNGGLTVTVEQDNPTASDDGSFGPVWGLAILGVGLIIMVTVLILSLTLIAIAVRKRYLQLRYERRMRIGLKQSEKFIADFEDPVSIAPSPTHHQQEDDVTLYDQFFPSGSHLSSTLSLDKRSYCDSLSQFGITSDDVFEHLQRFSINVLDHYQQDSGIGEYPGGGKSEDFGSAFSGPSVSSYVHCAQYNCMCDMCTTSREGKSSRADGKSPCERGPSPNDDTAAKEHKFLSRTSSLSLPELRSCDGHVTTPMTASLSTEML